MRGTLQHPCHDSQKRGIIPAHAGNTVKAGGTFSYYGDHPRACGEHRFFCPCFLAPWGSSPRMRGTPCARGLMAEHTGIIPAHAGNTLESRVEDLENRDHPRACGEHTLGHQRAPLLLGSSPRMRGTRYLRAVNRRIDGIIPAHAGNTRGGGSFCQEDGDHPRACGEHCLISPHIRL